MSASDKNSLWVSGDMEMKRILVFGMTENPGGVESFLMNYYRHIDRSELQFDFLCNTYNPVAFEDELLSLGGRVYHICPRRKNRYRFRKELNQVFAEHAQDWSGIWVNLNSLANIDYLKIAKRYGTPRRIIHSHNAQNMDGRLRGMLHSLNRKTISRYATDFWACSETAAKWFYSDRLMEKTVIIRNAIDGEALVFSEEKREEIRRGIGAAAETFVVGDIGRLHFQKNQSFLLDVMAEYDRTDPDWLLVLVGQGEDEKMLREKCRKAGIENKVLFTGIQNDIQAWLSGFDLFAFPSLFEGLGIAALEAQVSGLPVIASEGVIPQEVKVTDGFVFWNLAQSPRGWAEKIASMRKTTDRKQSSAKALESIRNRGYDISREARELENRLLQRSPAAPV